MSANVKGLLFAVLVLAFMVLAAVFLSATVGSPVSIVASFLIGCLGGQVTALYWLHVGAFGL